MSSLSPVGRTAPAHQNVRASLCRLTVSDCRRCRSPRHNSFRINTYKMPRGRATRISAGHQPRVTNHVTNHRSRFLGARTSVRSKSSCVSLRRMSFVRAPSISTSLGRVRAL